MSANPAPQAGTEQLFQAWRKVARDEHLPLSPLPGLMLEATLPSLLAQLQEGVEAHADFDSLRGQLSGSLPAINSALELSEVVEEIRVLRAILRRQGPLPEALHAALDTFISLAIEAHLRQQKAALRQSEAWTQLAVEAAGLGTWEHDLGTNERHWSPRAKELFGLPPDARVTHEWFLSLLSPEDRRSWEEAFAHALDPGGDGRYRLVFRTPVPGDPHEHWFASWGRALFEGGKAVRLLGALQDITALKRAEQEHEIFIGVLGHDLRNPLAAISVAATLLGKRDDPAVVKLAERVGRSASRMQRMIDDLLEFTRARNIGIQLHLEPVDLEQLCREAISELELTYPGRTIVFRHWGRTTGRWDRDRLAQVIQNLGVNALTHGAQEEPISLVVTGDGTIVTLEVTNTGEPIPAELLPTLFQPFRRGTQSGAGLGLGLYIAHQIVAAHQGTIDVTSDRTRTVFRVRLPVAG